MPTKRIPFNIKAPFKGMLSGNNPSIDPAYFSKAYNIFFDKQGVPEKRSGITKIRETGGKIISLDNYDK